MEQARNLMHRIQEKEAKPIDQSLRTKRRTSSRRRRLRRGIPKRQRRAVTAGPRRGTSSTDGSSTGSGALRRAGWAVVAVDNVGNLKAAAYGAVPCDVLPGQTSRDGEDYAAAMAGHITLDPLTLHIDCESSIATVNGPKCKVLRAQGPRAHVWTKKTRASMTKRRTQDKHPHRLRTM